MANGATELETLLSGRNSVSPAPQYLVLRDQIARAIETGRLTPGERLPSERRFQDGSGAARGTVREALFQLEAEGLVYRRDRSGWYVTPSAVTYDPTRWSGFMSYVAEQGRVPATETLTKQTRPASASVSEIFRIAPGARLHHITRRRSIDGRASLIEHIVVDPALAPDLMEQALDGSLTQILSGRYGLSVRRNRVDMRPCALVEDTAAALGVRPGAPGLLVVRTSLDAAGRVVEYDREYWRHDAIRIHIDLQV